MRKPASASAPVQEPKEDAAEHPKAEMCVAARDAWSRAYELAAGLRDLLETLGSSDLDVTRKGVKALHALSERLLREMDVVNEEVG